MEEKDRERTSHTIVNLLPNTTYYFTIRVYDSSGLYTDSEQVIGKTLPTIPIELPPIAVILKKASNITKNSLILSWSENNDDDFANYTIFMATNSTSLGEEVKVITDRTTTSFKVTGLSPSTTYYFVVRVYDADGLYNDSNQIEVKTLGEKVELKVAETNYFLIGLLIATFISIAVSIIILVRMKIGNI
ncbi:MAG: fibronectin type III domain-containing protein [Candidatus Thermoplasmatota archaeon]